MSSKITTAEDATVEVLHVLMDSGFEPADDHPKRWVAQYGWDAYRVEETPANSLPDLTLVRTDDDEIVVQRTTYNGVIISEARLNQNSTGRRWLAAMLAA